MSCNICCLGTARTGRSADARLKQEGSQMAAKKTATKGPKIVADNRKARFNYEIGETFEAGIALDRWEEYLVRLVG